MHYSLEPGGPKRLELTQHFVSGDLSICLDGKDVGVIPRRELRPGRSWDFALPDGSSLHLRSRWLYGLCISRDGIPLPGGPDDPATRLRGAYTIIFIIACLNLLVGAALSLWLPSSLEEVVGRGTGAGILCVGFVYLVLGFFVRRGAGAALWVAIILYGLDSLLSFIAVPMMIASLPVRALFFILMARGISAIRDIESEGRASGG